MSEPNEAVDAPRTRHLDAEGKPRYVNRLAREASPYLRQHAHNPVDWYPWGEEAFERARREDKPIFLSIGYATCHWCHVMEEESFEDEAVAQLLNASFVCVKVDREERPDVDGVYMAAVQAFTGRGGWPMSVFLMPSAEVFFAGTYFPPRAGVRGATRGMEELLPLLAEAYVSDREKVSTEATKLSALVRRSLGVQSGNKPATSSSLDLAVKFASSRFDASNGGVRGAPKFPATFPVRLLLRHAAKKSDASALSMAKLTLAKMRDGGIHDALDGGFHRYSTDGRWLVPHFEKMLYDNALLASAYLEAGDEELVAVARRTLDHLARRMRSAEGLFYSATDADSLTPSGALEEGYYFTFTKDEVVTELGDDAEVALAWFGISEEGHLDGRSVPTSPADPKALASSLGLSRADLEVRAERARIRLLALREKRPAPLVDRKLIVAWNALTVSAFARASLLFCDSEFEQIARRAYEGLVARFRAEGVLPHLITSGSSPEAFLDDHAFLAAAALDLFELTADLAFLDDALALARVLEEHFLDKESGAYFVSSSRAERLLAREIPLRDGALPSGNSIAALVHLRLSEWLRDEHHRSRAEALARVFGGLLPERAPILEHALIAVSILHSTPSTLVLVLPDGEGALTSSARPFVELVASRLEPMTSLLVASESALSKLSKRIPDAEAKRCIDAKPTAYLCEGGSCLQPMTSIEALRDALG